MNIYVGNLAHAVTEDELREAFTAYGDVSSVTLIKDKFTGESRGFAAVRQGSGPQPYPVTITTPTCTTRNRYITVAKGL